MTDDRSKKTTEYKYFNGDNEWEFHGLKVDLMDLIDNELNATYSAVKVGLSFKREHPFYSLTLIIPIMMLVVISPLGMYLPCKYSTVFNSRLAC